MLKKFLYTISVVSLLGSQVAFAFQPKEMSLYFNGPSVSNVTASSARVYLPEGVLSGITPEEKSGVYFEYNETNQVCIAIYPTPVECLPKKTELGKLDVTISNLKPDTSYTVVYKRDNTIRCITTPCPENGFVSLSNTFTTSKLNVETPPVPSIRVTSNLWFGSRGAQVVALQTILINRGFMQGTATGYFGVLTLKGVKEFQRYNSITPTGYVGPLTRKALLLYPIVMPMTVSNAETFEGTITAYSTQCFVDGICSISVDGKKIITTRGWSQEVVGVVTGIPDFGSIENKVGARAKVYAQKTEDGYTLYGNANYYIQIQ